MKRVLDSIYHYTDFRLLLNDDYLRRADLNPAYSLRAYARDIEVSVSHLSKVLNRKKFFSLETAKHILKSIDVWEEDSQFARHLVLAETLNSDEERLVARTYLKKNSIGHGFTPKPEKGAVLKSLENFLFYGMVIKFSSIKRINEIFSIMGYDLKLVKDAQEDLLKSDYININGDSVCVTDREFFIETHDDLYKHHVAFNDFIGQEILKKQYLDHPDSDGKGALLGLDDESAVELKNHIQHFFRGVYRIANKTKNPDKLVFLSTSLVGWQTGKHHKD